MDFEEFEAKDVDKLENETKRIITHSCYLHWFSINYEFAMAGLVSLSG